MEIEGLDEVLPMREKMAQLIRRIEVMYMNIFLPDESCFCPAAGLAVCIGRAGIPPFRGLCRLEGSEGFRKGSKGIPLIMYSLRFLRLS